MISVPPRQWKERVPQGDPVALAAALGISPVLAGHLCRRGVSDPEAATRFLGPRLADMADPRRMAGMPEAVTRLARAVVSGERVGLCGDYDVDGVTSTTLMTEVLRALGLDPVLHIPHRIRDGYGLNKGAVDALKAAGCSLLLTLDCGVTAHAEVQHAVDQGMEVIVIDHHTVPVTLPRAVAVLNPHRPDCDFPYKQLCAVGVTFFLCVALRAALRESGQSAAARELDLRAWLDLVALGTVADLVPLTGQNRLLVTHGLAVMAHARRVGLKALMNVSGVNPVEVDAQDLAFQLGPRINAAGRLQDAMVGVQLLLTSDPARAAELAGVLDQENQARKDVQQQTVDAALERARTEDVHANARALVLYDEGWHPGVVGIAAQRMVEAFHRPSILVGAGGKGSGRSIEAFHLHEALVATGHHLEGFGGHAHAAGLRLDPRKLDEFRSALYAHASTMLTDEQMVPRTYHDGALAPSAVNDATLDALERAAPFGRGNAEPVFVLPQVRAVGTRVVGKTAEHVQVDLGGVLKGIAFRMADRAEAMRGGPGDYLFAPRREVWNGNRRLQLHVKDFRVAGGVSA